MGSGTSTDDDTARASAAWAADAESLDAGSAFCAAAACERLDDPRGARAWFGSAARLGRPDAARALKQPVGAGRAVTGGDRNRRRPASHRGDTRPDVTVRPGARRR